MRGLIFTEDYYRLLLWGVVVGLVSGGTAVLFRVLAIWLPALVWHAGPNLSHAVAAAPSWARIVVPVVGGLSAGLVLNLGTRWTGRERGWDILEAVVVREGILHAKPAIVKSASSLLTVSSAGAIGREGPMVLLSATAASVLGRRVGAATRQLRILVGCGAAAGIAAAYNTPIGAALFTMEILLGNFDLEVFAPLVFSSVSATLIAHAVFGSGPIFRIPSFAEFNSWEMALFIVLGLIGGTVAAVFLQALRAASVVFRRSRLPRLWAMAMVGLGLGITIIWVPGVVGNGREGIRDLFQHEWGVTYSLLLLALRLLLTPATVGSGAVGGVFTPTLFIGAVLGEAFGSFLSHLAPGVVSSPKAYALVGMVSLLAGTTHAPITALIMVFEMTLDYQLILPLLLAAAASSLMARRFSEDSVYTEALKRKRGVFPPEAAAIRLMKVRDVMRTEQVTVGGDLPLSQVLDRFIAARRNHLYVVDPDGRFEGVIGLHDVTHALRELEEPEKLRARDMVNPRFGAVTPGEPLHRVLDLFWSSETERLPVLEDHRSRRLVGTVSQRDILGIYSLEAMHHKTSVARFESPKDHAAFRYIELPAEHQIDEIPVPAAVIGMTVGQARFRERYGASILLVHRPEVGGQEVRILPTPATELKRDDRLIVLGPRDRLHGLRIEPRPEDRA